MANEALQRLLSGVDKFYREIYPQRKDAYQQAVREGQDPQALFITCADSRIDPELLTQSGPGDIFVTRNIGNMVPAYGSAIGGVSSVIEYATTALNVKHIVVCGHSDCGAVKGLLAPESLGSMPTVKAWLQHGEAALSVVKARRPDISDKDAVDFLIDENVLLQLNHLRTHPSVAGRLANGTLTLSGWVYDIAHGTVRIYDEKAGEFRPFQSLVSETPKANAERA
jgi:carbonic anhydrase